jgi:hypothetical protein
LAGQHQDSLSAGAAWVVRLSEFDLLEPLSGSILDTCTDDFFLSSFLSGLRCDLLDNDLSQPSDLVRATCLSGLRYRPTLFSLSSECVLFNTLSAGAARFVSLSDFDLDRPRSGSILDNFSNDFFLSSFLSRLRGDLLDNDLSQSYDLVRATCLSGLDVNSLTTHDVLGGAQILTTDQILF